MEATNTNPVYEDVQNEAWLKSVIERAWDIRAMHDTLALDEGRWVADISRSGEDMIIEEMAEKMDEDENVIRALLHLTRRFGSHTNTTIDVILRGELPSRNELDAMPLSGRGTQLEAFRAARALIDSLWDAEQRTRVAEEINGVCTDSHESSEECEVDDLRVSTWRAAKAAKRTPRKSGEELDWIKRRKRFDSLVIDNAKNLRWQQALEAHKARCDSKGRFENPDLEDEPYIYIGPDRNIYEQAVDRVRSQSDLEMRCVQRDPLLTSEESGMKDDEVFIVVYPNGQPFIKRVGVNEIAPFSASTLKVEEKPVE